MSLRKPLRTPALLAVHRANALKSTGPRAVQEASDSTLNTFEPGIYSRHLYDAMAELGEDPREHERLFGELVESHHPKNPAQRMLVEDIAWLRWQKRRNQRAQAGLMVQARERVTNQRAKRRLELDREISDAPAAEVRRHGLMSLPDSPSKFEKMRSVLDTLIDQARRNDFALDAEPALTLLYGEERTTLRATRLTNGFRRLRRLDRELSVEEAEGQPGTSPVPGQPGGVHTHAPGETPFLDPPKGETEEPSATDESFEYERVLLLNELLDEKQQVNQAYEWYLKEHVDVTPALLNACFSPNDKEWRALRLQERTYDHEIERKIIVLMQMQKPKDGSVKPRRDPGSGKYMRKHNVTECSETDGDTR